MKLVVHIGAHKTGSTAIQQLAVLEHRRLVEAGIWYPVGLYTELPTQHSRVFAELEGGTSDALASRFSNVLSDARTADCNTVFLSGEDLSACDFQRVARLHDIVSASFEDVVVPIVLREKHQYFESHYNHHLKFGRQIFLTDFPKAVQFSPARTVEVWRKVFGSSSVHVIPYQSSEPLLVRFYRDVLGVDVKNPERYEGVNRSIDFFSAFLMNLVLKEAADYSPHDFLRIYFKTFGARRMHLAIQSKLAEQVSNLYPDSEWIVDGKSWVEAPQDFSNPSMTKPEMVEYLRCLAKVISDYADAFQSGHTSEGIDDQGFPLGSSMIK